MVTLQLMEGNNVIELHNPPGGISTIYACPLLITKLRVSTIVASRD